MVDKVRLGDGETPWAIGDVISDEGDDVKKPIHSLIGPNSKLLISKNTQNIRELSQNNITPSAINADVYVEIGGIYNNNVVTQGPGVATSIREYIDARLEIILKELKRRFNIHDNVDNFFVPEIIFNEVEFEIIIAKDPETNIPYAYFKPESITKLLNMVYKYKIKQEEKRRQKVRTPTQSAQQQHPIH